MRTRLLYLKMALILSAASAGAEEVELKDIVNVQGVRSNKLVGYGVVSGLAGTGDSAASLPTRKAAASMLTKLGMKTTPEEVVTGNIAAVIVTAELPPFARNGDELDVRISAQSDATSLKGGTLLLTPLRAGDGKTYAVAQGVVVVGSDANSVATVAIVPGGAQVEREFQARYQSKGKLRLSLKKSDFTTNLHVANAINQHFRGFYAKSLDPSTLSVEIPKLFEDDVVRFVSELEKLRVKVDRKAVVVINERSATVVMGNDVSIAPVTIAHGTLSIKVGEGESVGAETMVAVDKVTVGGLVKSLNQLGVKPTDLVGILQAIAAAGALNARLVYL